LGYKLKIAYGLVEFITLSPSHAVLGIIMSSQYLIRELVVRIDGEVGDFEFDKIARD
jgi:hypothetical protein